MPSEYQQDHRLTLQYAPKIYLDPNVFESNKKIYRNLEKCPIHEGRTIDPTFYEDTTADTLAKFSVIGVDCPLNLNEEICPRENAYVAIGNRDHVQASIALMFYCLEAGRHSILPTLLVKRMDFFRDRVDNVLPYGMILTHLFKHLVSNMEHHPFDDRCTLHPRLISSLKSKQPRKLPPKKPRNLGKFKRAELPSTSSSKLGHSDNRDFPSTKLSPRSYCRALLTHENMSQDQRGTRSMFMNLVQALHKMGKALKKECR
ncbi:hypothetical protein Tco_0798256 [Tanacetum coccineum]